MTKESDVTRIEQAAAAVGAARAVLADLGSLARAPRDEVVDLLGLVAELTRLADAQRVRLAGEIAQRSLGSAEQALCRRLGARDARHAVASAFGLRSREAQALLAMAAATAPQVGLSGGEIAVRYPRVAAALEGAQISLAQARAIVEHLEPAAPRAELDMLAWAEGALVDAATDPDAPLAPELLVTQARAYVAVLDPDGVLPSAERHRAMRSLRLWQQDDGMWQLKMLCPPEAGSAIKALLDAYLSPRVRVAFRDDEDPAGGGDGLGASSAPDGDEAEDARQPASEASIDDRSPEQKRHDVLLGLVQAHAASGDAPVAAGEAPVLVLTGTIDAYDAYLHGRPSPERTLTIEHTGALVPIETIDRFACDAIIRRAITDARGHVLDLGRTERFFNRAQRRALALRDRGCRVPGCGLPAAWSEAHHIMWWEHGGPTDIDNGILLCSYHHHEVHAGRLLIEPAGPAPGHWRIRPQLRPADRYARATRSSGSSSSSSDSSDTTASSSASSSASSATTTRSDATSRTTLEWAPMPSPRSIGPRRTTAADAAPRLAVKLPDDDQRQVLDAPRPVPQALVAPRPRRSHPGAGRSGSLIESRLWRRVRSAPAPQHLARVDRPPSTRMVLRT